MNRLVLIGNGFDLAHGMKTSYKDFIHWYWKQRIDNLSKETGTDSDDGLCKITMNARSNWGYLLSHAFVHEKPAEQVLAFMIDQRWCSLHQYSLLDRISKGIEIKTWAGIESDYYDLLKEYAFSQLYDETQSAEQIDSLNRQLAILQAKLVEYLREEEKQSIAQSKDIADAIYAPIDTQDVAVPERYHIAEHIEFWTRQGAEALNMRQQIFHISKDEYDSVRDTEGNPICLTFGNADAPIIYRFPSKIMLVNFNYTATPERYLRKAVAEVNYIHGKLNDPEHVIFGYGDEIDEDFMKFKTHKNNACLKNAKTYHYLEAPNYSQILSFIEAEPFQVLVMGHSCGMCDRTLLNTIFEHKNCVSIKPYYYQKEDGTDDYISLVQSISRSFNDMKLMRVRVVNKTQCSPLTST